MKKVCLIFGLLVTSWATMAQRNVILIIADDLSADYFGFYEDHADTVDVPNIRALSQKGVRFRNGMSNPVCSSTRSTILTGRYSFRTGVGGIVGGVGGSNQLDTSEISIPRLLKIYNPNIGKANIGKWHLHQPAPASNLLNPLKMGYDHFEGPFIGQLPSYTNWTKYTDGISSTITNYATSENVNNALDWVKTQSGKAFFLWLAFNAPHEPLHLAPSGLHTYTTLSGTAADINAHPKSYFKAMIQAMDHEIGRLFDSLRVLNRLDSTDVIFIGDNGNTPRTAQIADTGKAKGTIYQYGVHVPIIISGPSVVAPNRASDALVNTADLFSTILELLGNTGWTASIPSGKPVDSKSLMPIIKNTGTDIRPWSFCELFKLTTDSSDGKAIRNKDYKLIRFDYGAEEFYNLSLDANEANNLLLGKMSSTDVSNYNYLCTEIRSLIGSGLPCKDIVNIKESELKRQVVAFPNPFDTRFCVQAEHGDEFYELQNALGQSLFKGTKIAEQDFSALAKGVYFLKIIYANRESQIIRLIKN